jgi:hypothetical protein
MTHEGVHYELELFGHVLEAAGRDYHAFAGSVVRLREDGDGYQTCAVAWDSGKACRRDDGAGG